LQEISFGQTLLRLFQTARRFDIQIQPQLILFQKTLLTVEGMGRQLCPDLDLWNTALPCLEHWQQQRLGSNYLLRKIKNHAPTWLEKLPDLPALVYKALQGAQDPTLIPVNSASQGAATARPSVWYFILGAISATVLILLFVRL